MPDKIQVLTVDDNAANIQLSIKGLRMIMMLIQLKMAMSPWKN